MNLTDDCYDVEADGSEENCLRYFFVSEGLADIIKIVQYDLIGEYENKPLFNLGFGDWDIANQALNDSIVSQNGDQYKVLNTVLSTIPAFFEQNTSAIIMVQGSDSLPSYIQNCKINCRKKCVTECKNAHRRIKIYKGYIDKNFNLLKSQYKFSGAVLDESGLIENIEAYYTNNQFSVIFVEK